MRRIILSLVAAAGVLFATSCAKDATADYAAGDDGLVTFAISTENGMSTRTISDGLTATKLWYAVFNDLNGQVVAGYELQEHAEGIHKTATVELKLVKGQSYTAVFWAQADTDAYEVAMSDASDDITLKVNYENLTNNTEAYDAFYKAHSFKVTGNSQTENIVLRRPFAQINVGTTVEDWNAAAAQDLKIATSQAVVANAATTMSLKSGKVGDFEKITFADHAIPAVEGDAGESEPAKLTVKVDGEAKTYNYLSTTYVLAPTESEDGMGSALTSLTFMLTPDAGTGAYAPIELYEGLTNVPVQRNWRTNIIGNLLMGRVWFDIVIDENYFGDWNIEDGETTGGPYNGIEGLAYSNDTFYISSLEALKWFRDEAVKQSQGETADANAATYFEKKNVKLLVDIDLDGEDWTPVARFQGTFDGEGHTISNLTVKVEGNETKAGLFAQVWPHGTVKNLTVKDADIQSNHYAGIIVGYAYNLNLENCKAIGGEVYSIPNQQDGGLYDNGDKAGGLVGYVVLEGAQSIIGNMVEDVTVKAHRDLGGLIGTISAGDKAVIKDNTVRNSTVAVTRLFPYTDAYVPYNVGELVGRYTGSVKEIDTTTDNISNNKAYNVTTATPVANIQHPEDAGGKSVDEQVSDAIASGIFDVVLPEGYEAEHLPGHADEPKPGSPGYLGSTTHHDRNNFFLEGMTLDCNGAVFTASGTAQSDINHLNFNGATIKNAKFVNESGPAAGSYLWGNFVNCEFVGLSGTGYVTVAGIADKGDSNFENCTFTATAANGFSVTIGEAAGSVPTQIKANPEVTFKNCTFNGLVNLNTYLNMIKYNMEGCTFNEGENADEDHQGLGNFLSWTSFTNCVFNAASSSVDAPIALTPHWAAATTVYTFTNCYSDTAKSSKINAAYKGFSFWREKVQEYFDINAVFDGVSVVLNPAE